MLLATLCGFAAWLCTAIVLGNLRLGKQAMRHKVLRLRGEKVEGQYVKKRTGGVDLTCAYADPSSFHRPHPQGFSAWRQCIGTWGPSRRAAHAPRDRGAS